MIKELELVKRRNKRTENQMAETAICSVIDKLVSLLSEEMKLIGGVGKEVADIKEELESIQCFLKEADAKAEKEGINSSLNTWIKQVRNVAYRIEDVIDEYMLHVAQHQDQHVLQKLASMVGKLKKRNKIASEIQCIRSSIREIKERSGRYEFSSSSNMNMKNEKNPRLASLFLEEDQVVGLDSAKNELIECLINGASNRSVVSVLGMGGLGKTTLAKTVFDNDEVRRHFCCHAWVTVSQTYNTEELLRNVMRLFCQGMKESPPDGLNAMERVSLITELRQYMQQKRYVIVFDDVWKLDFWEDIEHAMPDNRVGSRIIITTRNNNVATFCKKSSFVHVHELKPLPSNDAFELFCKKTFQFDSEGHCDCDCPPELMELSLDIVSKCRGLPLAIVTIGGLLSTKDKNVLEWRKLHDSLGSEMSCNPHLINITEILSLSYLDLPYYLKPCFLYFGVFPEDFAVNRPRLFGHWIAQGFVKSQRGKTLEQVAEKYLTELVNRNLVQASWGRFNGVNKWCRVHDMWRELILSRITDSSFCHALEENDTNLDRKARRVSLHGNNAYKVVETMTGDHSQVRSVVIFKANESAPISNSVIVKLFHHFKLLKLLDFEDAPLYHLPSEVGNLFFLSYLSVRNTKLKKLPRSIGKLCNLETLNVSNTLIRILPAEISKLCKLRHLLARNVNIDSEQVGSVQGVKIKEGTSFGRLENLQTLVLVDPGHGAETATELEKLKELNVLGVIISQAREDGCRALCASIEKMQKLSALEVVASNESLNLDSISSPPELEDLFLKGHLGKLPNWVSKLENLVTIGLFSSGLHEDPLEALQDLPNLVNVYLSEAYKGDIVHVKEGGFRRLKLLSLRKLHELSCLIVDNGGATCLEELQIGPSPKLKEVPGGIQQLRNLKTLVFYDMPSEFSLRMLSDDRDSHKVIHIPTVLFNYRTSEERHETYNLGNPNLLEYLQHPRNRN